MKGGTLKRASSAGIREMARMELAAAAEGAGEGKEEETSALPQSRGQAASGGASGMSKAEQRRAARAAHFDRLFAAKSSGQV